MTLTTETLAAIADVSIGFAPPAVGGLGDRELLDDLARLGEISRRVDAVAAAYANEVALRSRHDLGHDGLAQRLGARTPQRLIQRLTGATQNEAHQLVRIGELTAPTTADSPPNLPSWLGAVGEAVRRGALSVAAADVIRSGLGVPGDGVPAEALARAAHALVELAATLTVEQLAAEARSARDDLDEAGVAERAARLRDRRYLHLTPLSDGMTRLAALLDPESAAIIVAAYDGATSPRRGGPRFVDSARDAAGEPGPGETRDDRTVEQVAVDALVDLVRLGTAVDPGEILPARRTEVVVHVDASDLDRRAGRGRIDGQTSAIPVTSVERIICDATTVPVLFDGDRRVLDVGRTQRLFTRRQRIALAARDRGCVFPGCDRPPSWCEAHHVREFAAGGATSIANGALLCRHHHLLVHDHGWRMRWAPGGWVVDPPVGSALELPESPSHRSLSRDAVPGASARRTMVGC